MTKGFASTYLGKQKQLTSEIPDPPSINTGFIVVIPAFCEPGIINSLESIWKCQRPSQVTEVIIVFNAPEDANPEVLDCNRKSKDATINWIREHPDDLLQFYILDILLQARDAGVGLARKTGMDEALRRFNAIGNSHGFILSFDADSTCDPNYLTAIEDVIKKKPATTGFTVYFEHPVYGSEFNDNIYKGIIQYEMHLRYVNLYLKYSGFPHANHTIGSCFGVRADVYAYQGGMNKKKGGEDFYFLHKIIPLGNFENINSTRVIPSPRDSFRVPFGTGPVIRRLAESREDMMTYEPASFRNLKQFFQLVPQLFTLPEEELIIKSNDLAKGIKQFLEINDFVNAIREIKENTASHESFKNRFFLWFDAFRIIKYLNYSAMHDYPKIPVTEACEQLLIELNYPGVCTEALSYLKTLRKLERGY